MDPSLSIMLPRYLDTLTASNELRMGELALNYRGNNERRKFLIEFHICRELENAEVNWEAALPIQETGDENYETCHLKGKDSL